MLGLNANRCGGATLRVRCWLLAMKVCALLHLDMLQCYRRRVEAASKPSAISQYYSCFLSAGGDSLSVTKGIVSRVAMVRYAASTRLLGIQIDAAVR